MQTSQRDKTIQNLKDCNCSEDLVHRLMSSLEAGQTKNVLDLLSLHRQALLEEFHRCNELIGCLDYLVYQIKNKKL